MSRRDFVKAAVVAASAAALGMGALAGVRPILPGRGSVRLPILRGVGEGASVPMTVQDLDGPTIALAVGQWMFLPAVVFKVPKATLRASSERRGYNTGQFALQHPMEPANAILAYDGKCTHLGCTVGFNATLGASKDIADYSGDGLPEGRILCPCHQAQFDVFDLANHVPGTPAPRPLDVLEIGFGPDQDGSPTLEAFRRIRQDRPRAADRDGEGAAFRLAG